MSNEKSRRGLCVGAVVACDAVGPSFSIYYDGDAWLASKAEHCITVLQGSNPNDDAPAEVEGVTVYTQGAARFLAEQLAAWADDEDARENERAAK